MTIRSKNKLLLLIISIFAYFITVGMSAVLLPIILKTNNVPDFLIGFSDNIKVFVGLLILIIIPKIASKLGIIETGIISLILYGTSILLLPLYYNYLVWMFLIFLFGSGFIIFRTMEETLANVISNNQNRGKIMGYVATSMLSGLSVGPIITKIFGVNNYFNFILAFVCVCISILCFYLIKNTKGNIKATAKFELFKFLKEMPLVFFSKFIMEFIVQVIFVFAVIYTMETTKYSAEDAGLFITAFSVSGFLNIFVGNFVDKVKNKNALMIFGVLFLFLCMILFPITLKINIILTYILFFLFGLCGSSIVFLSSMYILNSSYKKKELVSANSALTFSDAIAMICGSFFTGTCMQIYGAKGFFIPIYIIIALYFILCIFLLRKEKNYGKSGE